MKIDLESKESREAIIKAISSTLKDDFVSLKVIDIDIKKDVDFDGDEVLLINVVFEGKLKEGAGSALSAAVRHVRPQLEKLGENAFPLFSFISDREFKGRKLAAH